MKEKADTILENRADSLRGVTVIHDPDFAKGNQERPIIDAIIDRKKILSEDCQEFLEQEEEYYTKKHLPSEPEKALTRLLSDRFSFISSEHYYPAFSDEDRDLYNQMVSTLREQTEKQGKAKELTESLKTEPKAIGKLKLAIKAKEIFPNLEGIDKKIENLKKTALSEIIVDVKGNLESVKIYLNQNDFIKAEGEINIAQKEINGWGFPEGKPKELYKLIEDCQAAKVLLINHKNVYDEAIGKLAAIKAGLKSPNKRRQAINNYHTLREDKRYAGVSEIGSLESEIIQSREIGDLIDEVRLLFDEKKDWQRIYSICREVKKKGIPDQNVEQINEYHETAAAELGVLKVKQAVIAGDITSAQRNYDAVVSLRPEYKTRLTAEKAVIDKSTEENAVFQNLFQQAEELSQQNNLPDLIKALNIFKFLSGGGGGGGGLCV